MNAAAFIASAATDGNGALVLLTGISRLLGYLGFVLVVGTTFFLSWLWPAASVELVFIRLFHGGAALLFITAAATALTAYAGAQGKKVGEHAHEGAEGVTEPRPGASDELKKAQKQLKVVQWLIPVASGTVVVLGAQQGEQQRPTNVVSGIFHRD